jgi:hypothetical protein
MIEKILLEKITFNITQTISREMLENAVSIKVIEDLYSDNFLFLLRAEVWGEKIDSHDIAWPKDWWQAFKLRWFPKWVLTRWPVIYEHHHVEVNVIYPEYRPEILGDKQKISIRRWKSVDEQ